MRYLRKKKSLFLLLFLLSNVVWIVIMHKDAMYNSYVGDDRCHDTMNYQAFYSVKNEIEYCFYRKTAYPYRLSGGIIGVKP